MEVGIEISVVNGTYEEHQKTRRPVVESSSIQGRLHIPSDVRRLGRDLLNQQLWCWGKDICRAEGNILPRYGFVRKRPPEGKKGSSSYTLRPGPGSKVALWGFGVLYSNVEVGGLYLFRQGFSPRLLSDAALPEHVWKAAQLPKLVVPATAAECESARILLHDALGWIAAYEQWVREDLGSEYRRRSLDDCPAKVVVPAEEMASAWRRLASFFEAGRSRKAPRRLVHEAYAEKEKR